MQRDVLVCEFTEQDQQCVCSVCGRRVRKSHYPCDRHHAICTKQNGLGDRIEQWLSSYGVTQEEYVAVKKKFGLPATCNCDGRKEWFNKVGKFFGIDPDRYGPHKEAK